ncbi:uncharacterized protein LOC132607923 [Lycium barbarum]|uniref:uncharacterized protein LOC132607923 n=1 Tax=Lycium barbarum TaxID=112863 RepID=UPI00293E118B|nr:uncharacterized protein LOC132607923 [Lycium barbarum]
MAKNLHDPPFLFPSFYVSGNYYVITDATPCNWSMLPISIQCIRNHPNLSWEGKNNNYQKPYDPQTGGSMEETVEQWMAQQQQMMNEMQKSIHELERLVGQMAVFQTTARGSSTKNNKENVELIPAKRTEIEQKSVENVVEQPEVVVVPSAQRLQKQKLDSAYFKIVALTKESNSRVRSKIPLKLKDLGSCTISITIGNVELVDRSLAYPDGIIEDVLMKVGSFILPVDFVILDYEADKKVLLILGRRFLATVDAIIRVRKGNMSMIVDGQEATFDVFKATKLPAHYEDLKTITIAETKLTSAELDYFLSFKDTLQRALVYNKELEGNEEVKECLFILDTTCA